MMKTTRREVLKRAAYAAPVVLSLPAVPAFAQTGSGGGTGSGTDDELDCGGGEIFCFYEDPLEEGGTTVVGGLDQADPNALFCSCDS
jgi:hypothetical protein